MATKSAAYRRRLPFFNVVRQASSSTTDPPPHCVVLNVTPPRSTRLQRQQEEHLLAEACALVETLGFAVPLQETIRLRTVHPKTYIGKGKVLEMRGMLRATDAQALFVNTPVLTVLQQKNLAELCQVDEVWDRISVILAIFATRARTSEAKLQVELAQCKYALSHLVRGASAAYEQQRGASGTGFMAGGGEKALEVRRRLLRDQVKHLASKLKMVQRQRTEQRKHRTQPTVSLVGYTNVGKSSLLNALTNSQSVSVENRPFETLDTTTRALFLPALGVQGLLIDTVGFISDLPVELVASFRATLEEVVAADVLLHVRDASTIGTPLFAAQQLSVDKVLMDIGTSRHLERSVVEVWNKVDTLAEGSGQQEEYFRLLAEARTAERCVVPVSARQRLGLEDLKKAVGDRLLAGGHVVQPGEGETLDDEDEDEEAEEENTTAAELNEKKL